MGSCGSPPKLPPSPSACSWHVFPSSLQPCCFLRGSEYIADNIYTELTSTPSTSWEEDHEPGALIKPPALSSPQTPHKDLHGLQNTQEATLLTCMGGSPPSRVSALCSVPTRMAPLCPRTAAATASRRTGHAQTTTAKRTRSHPSRFRFSRA
jgi:hypothetical protein